MHNISSRNTKAQILSAYNELLAEYKRAQKELTTAQRAGASKPAPKPAAAPAAAGEASFDNVEAIIDNLSNLRGGLSTAFSGLQQELTARATNFQDTQSEIESIETELTGLYALDLDSVTLANLIHEYNDASESFEEGLSTRQEEFEADMKAKRKDWEQERSDHRAEVRERDAEVKKQRDREEAEYQYALGKKRQLDAEEYAETQKALQRELEEAEEARRKDWAAREDALAAQEEEFEKLKAEVESLEAKLEEAKKAAEAQGAAAARRDARNEADLRAKKHEGQLNLYRLRIEALDEKSSKQLTQIADLSRQLASAQTQAQELAVKAIEGASGSSSFEAIKELALEQARSLQKGK